MNAAGEIQHNIGSWQVVERATRSSLLRFSTAGSVDDGKSTFIGRLLHDTNNIYDDHLEALQRKSQRTGEGSSLALALVTDGLKAEQEQGITIDVAYRYFSTPKRWFILADSPGHEQYTRNMATAASTADLTIILIDARKGVLTQTKRHAFIASLLGVPRILVAINKMDLVDYAQDVFERIKGDFIEFAAKLGIKEVRFVPVSALQGDNVVQPSRHMPWYRGESVLDYLENVYVAGDRNLVDFRFPVQYVLRGASNFRGYAGQIASGQIRVGEEIVILPSMRKSRIKGIHVDSRDLSRRLVEVAEAPMSVAISLEDQIDISRGDMIVRPNNTPAARTQFEAMLIWMSESEMQAARPLLIRHTTRETKAFVEQIKYKVDVNTLSRKEGGALKLNEVARASISTTHPIFADAYNSNRATGSFVLIDPGTFHTVAAGLVLARHSAEGAELRSAPAAGAKSENLHAEAGLISRAERESKFGHKAVTLWFTGLSGSGKSSVARVLERSLFDSGRAIYRLDGDNLRFGLNRDLGFSSQDRSENIRRAAEVAHLFNQAGISVICAFISPNRSDREEARRIIGADNFVEIYMNTSLEVCESRDPHGLYKRARAGEIREFTGISAPYEAPSAPAISLDGGALEVEECARRVLDLLT